MAETTLTIRVDDELKAEFSAVAEAGERTAAQLLRLLMREQVEAAKAADAHDTWFRDAVGVGLAELEGSDSGSVDHDDVRARWAARRSELERRATS